MLVPLFVYGYHETVIEIGMMMTESLHKMWSLRSAIMTYFYLSLALLTRQLDNAAEPPAEPVLQQVRKYKAEIDFARQACETNYAMWSLLLEALIAEVNDDFAGAVTAFEVSPGRFCTSNFQSRLLTSALSLTGK
jgi:hypothetical protein